MNEIEQIGRTVEEAKALALEKLGISDTSKVRFEVIDEGSKGVFGIGTKFARVKAYIEGSETPQDKCEVLIKDILKFFNLKGRIVREEKEDSTILNIYGENLGILIGKHGQTLQALQYIINIIANKDLIKKKRIYIDIEGYRARREKSLIELANRTADKVRSEERTVILEPMQPAERRIIHLALKNNPYVSTFSQGEEPLRKVIIAPK